MTDHPQSPRRLPLDGIKVVEFTHMVMGPTCGLILGDLGADVIKIEPLKGDSTRKLIGSGAGFFAVIAALIAIFSQKVPSCPGGHTAKTSTPKARSLTFAPTALTTPEKSRPST